MSLILQNLLIQHNAIRIPFTTGSSIQDSMLKELFTQVPFYMQRILPLKHHFPFCKSPATDPPSKGTIPRKTEMMNELMLLLSETVSASRRRFYLIIHISCFL